MLDSVRAGGCFVPEVARMGVIEAACAYAEAGFYLVPVDPRTKHPGSVLGKGWPAMSSCDPKVIADRLILENRAIALHCGRSGLIVFDVDRPDEVPDILRPHLDNAPFQSTRSNDDRRGHYVFAMPSGRMIGNSNGKLGGAWGEVRGKNGVIIVEPSLHEKESEGGHYIWRRTGSVPILPDAVAVLLPDASEASEACSDEGVEAFLKAHDSETHPALLDVVLQTFAREVARGASRHASAMSALAWGMREAAAGLYSARRVSQELELRFIDSLRSERDGHKEFRDMVAWSIAQASGDDTDETRRTVLERIGATSASQAVTEGSKNKSQTTQIVELAESLYAFGISTTGQTFAVPSEGLKVAMLLGSSATGLKHELSNRYYEKYGSAPSGNAVRDALNTIEGKARHAPEHETLYRRTAIHNGEVWLDLGDATGLAVQVSSEGWARAEPPVLFVRSEASHPLPVPEPGGNIEDLRRLLNIKPHFFELLIAWLVAAFIHDISHPLLNINGEHGTGKSMFSRLIVRLLDPSAAELRAIPRNLEDWAVSANDSYVVALDNVSSLSQELSDALCRAVTGDSVVRRKRYTDNETTVLKFRRVVILNNIGLRRIAGDLADRMLSIELEPIMDSDRMTEKELVAAFEREYPQFLGALLDVVAESLRVRSEVQLDSHPRMADFAEIVAAVDVVRGTDALSTYLAQGDENATTVIEGDIVGATLRNFIDAHESWSGTATELLRQMQTFDPAIEGAKFWPSTPEAMGKTLKQLAPSLRQLGYTAEPSRNGSGRTWCLAAPPSEEAPKPRKARRRRVVHRKPDRHPPADA